MSPEAFRNCVNEVKRIAVMREPEYDLPSDSHIEGVVKRILSIASADEAEKKPIDWLAFAATRDWNNEWEYSLAKIKEKFEVREVCHEGYLVLFPQDEYWLRFAVMGWHSEDEEGIPTIYPQFYGEGPSSVLREPRHFYFGESGYLFYPNAKVIKAGLEALREFYDFPGEQEGK